MSNPSFVAEWLKGKRAEDFDAIEHAGGRLIWPTRLNRRRADKTWHEEPAYLQPLDGIDLIEAKSKAMGLFDARGFKADDPRAADIWNELEAYSQVAIALREPKPNAAGVYPQKHTLEQLLSARECGIPRPEVFNLYSQLQVFSKFDDARLEELDTETVVKAALAIDEVRNISPLVAIAGSEQDTYVVSSAVLLSSYLRGASSAPSKETSTPDTSPSTSSA